MKKHKKNLLWITDIDTMLEVYELAKKRGKKPGDSVEDEFLEIIKQKKDKAKLVGTTNKDLDLLCGDCREAGLKVFNMKEYERKRKRDKDNKN